MVDTHERRLEHKKIEEVLVMVRRELGSGTVISIAKPRTTSDTPDISCGVSSIANSPRGVRDIAAPPRKRAQSSDTHSARPRCFIAPPPPLPEDVEKMRVQSVPVPKLCLTIPTIAQQQPHQHPPSPRTPAVQQVAEQQPRQPTCLPATPHPALIHDMPHQSLIHPQLTTFPAPPFQHLPPPHSLQPPATHVPHQTQDAHVHVSTHDDWMHVSASEYFFCCSGTA